VRRLLHKERGMNDWVINRVREIVRTVKVNQAGPNDTWIVKTMKVGLKVHDLKADQELRQAIMDERPQPLDVEFEHFKRNVVTSIEGGPVDEKGEKYSIDECLWMGDVRTAIDAEYRTVCLGLRRKN
jgi:hypothetical protein